MFGTLRLHLNRLSVKQRSSGLVDAESAVSEVFRFYTRITRKLVDAERCSIFISDPESDKVWLKAGTGVQEGGIEVSTKGSVVGEAIQAGKTVTRNNMESRSGVHKECDDQTGFVTQNILCVPIMDPNLGEAVGAIQVLNKQGDTEFSVEDAEMLCDVAAQIQTRVSRIYLNQEIFGLSEKVLNAASQALTYTLVGIFVLVAIIMLILLVWVLTPVFQ
jgi:GAF domain-containing protein